MLAALPAFISEGPHAQNHTQPAAEARSASAPLGLFLSTVTVADSVAGNALSSSFLWLDT